MPTDNQSAQTAISAREKKRAKVAEIKAKIAELKSKAQQLPTGSAQKGEFAIRVNKLQKQLTLHQM